MAVHPEKWSSDPKTHHGIPSELLEIPSSAVEIKNSQDGDGDYAEIAVPNDFEPGSIMVFATEMTVSRTYSQANIQEMGKDLDEICKSGADEAMAGLDLVDLNVVLHRADGEEKDATGESRCSTRLKRQVATAHMLSPATAVCLTAVSRAGCTRSGKSWSRTTSGMLCALTLETALGLWIMSSNVLRSASNDESR